MTGRMIESPLDKMNRPRASAGPHLPCRRRRAEVEQLFTGWRGELATYRKFAAAARNYAGPPGWKPDLGLRVNEARILDLHDVRWSWTGSAT